ncbi:hypothetical protein [Paraburkholderia kururiensis]|uniref:Uncharacterized protein n=1 Tax=Paraburkholderia kururiensis TaxID=984307 RepID=A0ABZ0WLN4_9BURK|nr:hypothetical protein [Paraburkholderia kururiensis]WQD78269.1 hypothetical protein U0042_00695 [Paraburkholderia kururiensis]
MALDTNQVQAIADVLRTAPTLFDAAASWRERYPAVRTLRVAAADMRDETPALECGTRRAYFAMSNGMCVSVTREAAEANMVIFAEDGAAHGTR